MPQSSKNGTHWHKSCQSFTNWRTFVHVTRELVFYVDRLLVSTVDGFNDLRNWIGTDWHRIDIRLASD